MAEQRDNAHISGNEKRVRKLVNAHNEVNHGVGDMYGLMRKEAVATSTLHTGEDEGKGKRKKFPSTKLRGYATNTIRSVSPVSPLSLSTSNQSTCMSYPIAHFINCDRFFVGHRIFSCSYFCRCRTQIF